HLLLVDLRPQDITGKDAEEALGRAGIHVNKNTVPGDPRSPFVTSGIRLGSSALTSRGMMEEEMAQIAGLIDDVLRSADSETVERVASQVRELTGAFPLYPSLARV
ncbi:MAG: serine hydroxymethyltransferase, partial [Gemmatimonadales bacterium]